MSALQLQLSCITSSVLRRVADGSTKQAWTGDIALAGGLPVRIGTRASLAIVIKQYYHLIEQPGGPRDQRWNVQVKTYIYRLLDADHRELISWHWHPNDPNAAKHHHFHLGQAAQVGRVEFHRAHLPTGIVTLADVVRSAITDFHVEPRRADWQTILDTVS
ncbi:MAG TPA: hypothetical protein VEX37_11260 [Thermomicrobiales bacterium]|nr:hypothetical protein [Thermomicrobiales bacterium]